MSRSSHISKLGFARLLHPSLGALLAGMMVLGACASDNSTQATNRAPSLSPPIQQAPETEAPAPAAEPAPDMQAAPANATPEVQAPSPDKTASTPAPKASSSLTDRPSSPAPKATPGRTAAASPSSAAPASPTGTKSQAGSAASSPAPQPAPQAGNEGLGQATDVGVTADEIRVGAVYGFGMPLLSNLFKSMDQMGQAIFRATNDAGGIYGRKFKYENCDDGNSDPARARACYKKLVEQSKVFALWGGCTFTENEIAVQVTRDQVPWFSSCSLYQVQWDSPWVFPIHMSMQHEATAGGKWVRDILKPKTFGLICLRVPEMQEACDTAAKVLQDAGAKMVHRVNVELSNPDMSGDVLAMRTANPDHILHYTTNPAYAGKFMIEAAQQNYWPPKGISGNHMAYTGLGDLLGQFPARGYWTNTTYLLWGPEFSAWMKRYVPGWADNLNHVQQGQWWQSLALMEKIKALGPNLTRARIKASMESEELWQTPLGLGQKFTWAPAQRSAPGTGNATEYMYKYQSSDTYQRGDKAAPPGLVPDPDRFKISIHD